MDILLDANPEQWLELWRRAPERSIFSHPDFLAALPVTVRFAMAKSGQGDLVGAPLLFDAEQKPLAPGRLPCIYHGLHTASTAIACHSRLPRLLRLTDTLVAAILREHGEAHLYNSWRVEDLRALQWHNYHVQDRGVFRLSLGYTGVLDLTEFVNFEGYLSSIRSCRRQENNRFHQGSLTLSEGVGAEELERVYRAMFQAKGRAVHAEEAVVLRNLAAAATEKGFGRVVACRDGGRLVGAVVFLWDDRSAYYLFGMTDPKHRRDFSNTALLLDSIRDAFDRGLAEVDLVGVNSPQRGDWKISFNPHLRPYVLAHCKEEGHP